MPCGSQHPKRNSHFVTFADIASSKKWLSHGFPWHWLMISFWAAPHGPSAGCTGPCVGTATAILVAQRCRKHRRSRSMFAARSVQSDCMMEECMECGVWIDFGVRVREPQTPKWIVSKCLEVLVSIGKSHICNYPIQR